MPRTNPHHAQNTDADIFGESDQGLGGGVASVGERQLLDDRREDEG